MAYLDRYLSLLSAAQRSEIEAYIKTRVRQGKIRGQADFSKSLAAAISQVTPDNLPITKVLPVEALSRTNAELYNSFMGSFLVDIRALFRECNLSDHLIGLEEAHNKDFQDTATSLIKSIRGELMARKSQLASVQGYMSVFYEPYDDPGNREFDGVELHRSELRVSPYSSEIHVFDIEHIEILRYPRAGVTYVTDPEFDPVTNPMVLAPGASRGYWAEMALTDGIPTVEFRNDPEIPMDRKFNGILAVCRITFSMPVSLNALGLDMYCEFPLTIPWLRYRASSAGAWQYLTREGVRIAASGSGYTYVGNLDRALVKVLEVPLVQTSASLINTVVPVSEGTQLQFFNDVVRGDLKELEHEVDKYLSEKSSNLSYKKTLTRLISSENTEAAVRAIFQILGLSCTPVRFSRVGLTGSQEDCLVQPASTEGSLLQNAFVYGLYGISPMSIVYRRGGTYRSPTFNNLSKQIVSATIEADYDTPDISSVGFFLELEGGDRFTILPRGVTRVREHIPVVPDKHGLPKAYYTNEAGPDEFVVATTSGEFRPLNRVFPSFYIDTGCDINFYRNGVLIPTDDLEVDETFRMFNILASGEEAYFAPFGMNDVLVVEYDVDPDYGSPGQKLEESPLVTASGEYIMQLDFDVDATRPRALYLTTPTSKWIEAREADYYLVDNAIVISGDQLATYFDDTDGISMLYQYYSFDEDFNGPIGRRDFSGSPHRVDIIEGSSRIVGKTVPAFSVVAKKYTGKFKLHGGMIELPHAPLVDFNLYNYDGTWKDDPERPGIRYAPIKVKVGSLPQDPVALDVTPYKTEEIPHLIPIAEIGVYQFYLKGNKLFFNVDETDLDITISYEYISSGARVAVELYTNKPGPSDYTPLVHDYTLHLGLL